MSGFTYDPKKVVVIVGGVTIGAFQKDVFLEVSYIEPQVTMKHDLDGNPIFSVTKAKGAEVTLNVEPNSNAHDLLSNYFDTQVRTGGGAFPLTVVDNNVPDGQTKFHSSVSRVSQMPNRQWGSEAQPVSYTILCGECSHTESGLPSSSAAGL